MEKSYTKRYKSFEQILENLSKAKFEDSSNIFILSGTIMMFNLAFDTAWKLIKDVLKEDFGITDFPSGSPKETLKKAESVGLIDNDIWIDMLNDRNELTHDYDIDIATDKFNKIIDEYLDIFLKLKNQIKKQNPS